ncbi:MAG: CPBP family intramembrane metalloprotease [Spirochaetia bacterium]|nr:CPBP family intramembrane metalloprotease [Spirochaetia bacterium]MBP5739524.1 CPBP family intramembrane metalloprotease [Spirochaetia bacterium]
MISKKAIGILKSLILPIALYLFIFSPFYSEMDQHMEITIGYALLSFFIASAELVTVILIMKLVNRIPLAETGFFSFSPKTLLNLIPGMFLILAIYLAGILAVFLLTGSADDPGIITVELKAPVWMLSIMMLAVGYCEEFFFRFYLVETLGSVLGKKIAIIISAVFFALGHLYQGYLAVTIIFFLALGFQWIYARYKSIHVNAIIHGLFDVVSVLLKGVV